MEQLKAEIESKRRQVSGQGWIRRGELEKRRETQYLQEQEAREKAKTPEIVPNPLPESLPQSNPSPSTQITPAEVVTRLRNISEPVRLFAEAFAEQCERLRAAERRIAEQGSASSRPSILNHQSRNKVYWDGFEEEAEGLESVDEIYADSQWLRDAREWDEYEERGEVYRKHKIHPLKLEAQALGYMTKVAFVHRWCSEMILLWQEDMSDLAAAPAKESLLEQKKLKESKQALKGLFQLLKLREIKEDVPNAFFLVARFCQIRSYTKAHDHYLSLSSGQIQWITEKPDTRHRGGMITSKNYTETISEGTYHLYTQSFKRLMSLCQRKYPTPPFKLENA